MIFPIKNWVCHPDRLINPPNGQKGYLKPSRFALIQARQSIIFNGLALLCIHGGMTALAVPLKKRIVFPPSAAAVHALSNVLIYTALLDGRSWYKNRNYREFESYAAVRFFPGLLMALTAPTIAYSISKYKIKAPVRLTVSYLGGGLSWLALSYIDCKSGGKQ